MFLRFISITKLYLKRFLSVLLLMLLVSLAWLTPVQSVRADYFQCFQQETGSSQCSTGRMLKESCFGASNSVAPKCCEGKIKDYYVEVDDQKSDVTVLAIHGGEIEEGTTKISQHIAKPRGWNLYTFSAQGRPQCLQKDSNFQRLHITSTHFNDTRAVELVKAHPKSVSIHGYREWRKYPDGVICVGGRNHAQIKAFISHVNANASSFSGSGSYPLKPIDASTASEGEDFCVDKKPYLKGTARMNIVNRNLRGRGLQLELGPVMRKDLAEGVGFRYDTLRTIIYGAIDEAMKF
ncbi:MAG: hypothetical protein N5P05_004074 (plasmid) [Chroococcopsis gigantea SAG 12.99]|jgi:phage replication-related protein YjqB (UPF0714/DUF867 family)|nr:hypothetical protein [Chroococcopsis gigantea SAG 12.99]